MALESTEPLTEMSKANQSHYRPEVTKGFQEVKVPRLRHNCPGGGKVVSLTHRLLSSPGNTPGTHFS